MRCDERAKLAAAADGGAQTLSTGSERELLTRNEEKERWEIKTFSIDFDFNFLVGTLGWDFRDCIGLIHNYRELAFRKKLNLLIYEHEMYWYLNLFWFLIYLPTLCTFQCTILTYFLFNWFLYISFFLVLLLMELFLNFILDCSVLGYRSGIDFYIDLISCVLVFLCISIYRIMSLVNKKFPFFPCNLDII